MKQSSGHCGKSRGFTLLETVTTASIAAIVLAMGIPAFNHFTATNRISSELNNLVTHLHMARSEALNRNTPAVLCPSRDGTGCLAEPEWHRGYILFVDKNLNHQPDAQELVLSYRQGSPDNPIQILSSTARKRITYRPDGMSPASNGTVVFCDRGGHVAPRAVIISNTGRPRLSHKQPDGSPLNCS